MCQSKHEKNGTFDDAEANIEKNERYRNHRNGSEMQFQEWHLHHQHMQCLSWKIQYLQYMLWDNQLQ